MEDIPAADIRHRAVPYQESGVAVNEGILNIHSVVVASRPGLISHELGRREKADCITLLTVSDLILKVKIKSCHGGGESLGHAWWKKNTLLQDMLSMDAAQRHSVPALEQLTRRKVESTIAVKWWEDSFGRIAKMIYNGQDDDLRPKVLRTVFGNRAALFRRSSPSREALLEVPRLLADLATCEADMEDHMLRFFEYHSSGRRYVAGSEQQVSEEEDTSSASDTTPEHDVNNSGLKRNSTQADLESPAPLGNKKAREG